MLSGGPAIRSISRAAAELLPVALYVLYSQVGGERGAPWHFRNRSRGRRRDLVFLTSTSCLSVVE